MALEFSIVTGRPPMFDRPLPVGQLNFPEWTRYAAAMQGIFERRYYTNHGPLTQELEDRLQQYLDVKHVVCVTNATIGLMMVAEALRLKGKVIMPSHTFVATAQSLKWCGLEPVFCDVDADTHQLAPQSIEPLIGPDVSAILAVNLWGGACDVDALQAIADRHKLSLYFDSAHGFGGRIRDVPIGNFGQAEVFSFHATKILSATEGGCVATNDDDVAARLRNIRSSYGAGPPVQVVKTSNGRMSEAQAAIALMGLEDMPTILARNKLLFNTYQDNLTGLPGLRLLAPVNTSTSNHQYAVCDIDEAEFGLSRDELLQLLHAENVFVRRYFYPGTHRVTGFNQNQIEDAARLPNTEKLCKTSMQLPLGARVDKLDVEKICELIQVAQRRAPELRGRLGEEVQ